MFKMMAGFSLNICTQQGTPLINGFVDHALWNRRRNVMATRHLRNCAILQGKASSQEVQ